MTSPKITLYSYFRGSCVWRVRALLNFKGIEYECKPVNVDLMQHKTPEFLELNPQGQLPVMEIEGHVLTQSASICEFIEEFFPDTKPVLPSDVYKRAVVREICNLLGTYIQPLQSPIIAGRIAQKYAENDQKHAFIMADWTPGIIVEGFQVLEKILTVHSGKYCVGDNITMADFFLVPQVYNAFRFKVDIEPFPVIRRIHENLMQEECFQKSHPSVQPDCPEHLK